MELKSLVHVGLIAALAACANGRSSQSARPAAGGADPVVAEVHGERIRASEIDGMLQAELAKLDSDYTQRRHDMRRQGLDAILFRKLVEHEAAKLRIDGETYLRREVESKLVAPDEAELKGFYAENAEKLAPLTYDEVRDKLAQFLMAQRRSEAILGLYARLKAEAHPIITLQPPPPLQKPAPVPEPKPIRRTAAVVEKEL